MVTKISSREVLAYLNHLGYDSIDAQQLKEFIRDLKKLIKYEERKRDEENSSAYTNSTPQVPDEENTDIFSTLFERGTVASKAKAVPKKESVISVQIKRSKSQPCCVGHNKENITFPKASKSECNSKDKSEMKEELNECKTENSQTSDLCHNVLSATENRKSVKKPDMKPTKSFIKPVIPIVIKSDPVALYHQYQAEWKRQKVPGEDKRADLRWAIREKMLGGPKAL